MTASPERALIAAMRSLAAADDGVKAVLGDPARLYDDHPPEPAFPYVTLGRAESAPSDSLERAALEHTVTLHVWSMYGGRAEAMDAIGALRAALHDQAPAMSGRRTILLLASYADVFRAGDGRATHGLLRFKAVTEPA